MKLKRIKLASIVSVAVLTAIAGIAYLQRRIEIHRLERRLIAAVESGDAAQAREALSLGGSPNAVDAVRSPALHTAALNGHEEIARLLIQHGADITRLDWMGNSALSIAAEQGDRPMVRLLLASGADPNDARSWHPAWMVACRNGDPPVVKEIIRGGGDVNSRNKSTSLTGLMAAAAAGNTELASYLLDRGADPNLISTQGLTAEDLALQSGHQRTAGAIDVGSDRVAPTEGSR